MRFIDNDRFFNLPDMRDARDALRRQDPVDHTINVYFTNLGRLLCGETYFSSSPLQGTLIDNDCARDPLDPFTSTWAHEMGHYFDLYHTHEMMPIECPTSPCPECPNGSNCRTTGDLLCDTPADPGLTWETVTSDCIYIGSPAGDLRPDPLRTADEQPDVLLEALVPECLYARPN